MLNSGCSFLEKAPICNSLCRTQTVLHGAPVNYGHSYLDLSEIWGQVVLLFHAVRATRRF